MVVLNRIYTRTGDTGTTALAAGGRRPKHDLRIDAFGTVDETNACIGMVRLHTEGHDLDPMLGRIQNDLFDLGADLCVPATEDEKAGERLRVKTEQIERLEAEIDAMNENLEPLKSFVLSGGTAGAAQLHLARCVARRCEREVLELAGLELINPEVPRYLNRLSDHLFVAARHLNRDGDNEVLWKPGG